MLLDVILKKGVCWRCQSSISEEWAGKDPMLGTTCKSCSSAETPLFSKKNIQLVVNRSHKDGQEFAGTKVMVNGQVGTVRSTQGDCSYVEFPDNSFVPLAELGHWKLLQIARQ